MRRVLREISFFAFFVALSVIFLWPLPAQLSRAISDQGDPLLNAWIIDWVCYALTHSPLELYNAPMYYPGKFPLAYSENLIGIAVFMVPFHLAGLSAITVYNIALLLGFAQSGYGAFVLGRMVSRSAFAGVIAGIFFAFVNFKFAHIAHVQILWSGWLPLLLAALIAYWDRPTRRRAAAVFAAFVFNGLTNIHWLLFGGFASVVTLVLFAILYPRRDRAFWQPMLTALGAAGVVLLPFLIPYVVVSRAYEMKRTLGEVTGGSAVWTDWLKTSGQSWLYRRFQTELAPAERQLFPGMLVLFLGSAAALLIPRRAAASEPMGTHGEGGPSRGTLFAIDTSIAILAIVSWITLVSAGYELVWRGTRLLSVSTSATPVTLLVILILIRFSMRLPEALRARRPSLRGALTNSRYPPAMWAALVWIVIGFLGSFGTNGFLHPFLYRFLPPFRSVRAAGRWGIIVYTGLIVWAAVGLTLLLARRAGWRKVATAVLVVTFSVAEAMPMNRWDYVVPGTPQVYTWLREQRVAPIVSMPLANPWSIHFQYLRYQTEHRLPMLNGTSGFETPRHYRLRWKTDNNELDDEYYRLIAEAGAKLLILHPDALGLTRARVFEWLQREMKRGRIVLVRRFDGGFAGDYVFALPTNMPDWQRLRDTRPDALGRTPDQNLARVFAGQNVYSDPTIARLEVPQHQGHYEGPLHMSGWAMSPYGIKRVTFLLDGGRVRIPAQEFGRPDVASMLPWYPETTDPGFVAEMSSRPPNVSPEATLQVEIVDGANRITLLPTVHFHWD